jgi:histidinol-phosphate/aromatic aminotransferase/cobyric acid decarboxylase-like protein
MTRGRLWIGVLGALLVGIVALNVVNLSFTANAAKIDAQIAALESENGVLEARQATRFSVDRLQAAGREMGYVQPSMAEAHFVEFDRETLANAAQRLAAASP